MADQRTLLNKTYSAEELGDVFRDVGESFDPRFTPAAGGIPQDEHGFQKGQFLVSVVWFEDVQR